MVVLWWLESELCWKTCPLIFESGNDHPWPFHTTSLRHIAKWQPGWRECTWHGIFLDWNENQKTPRSFSLPKMRFKPSWLVRGNASGDFCSPKKGETSSSKRQCHRAEKTPSASSLHRNSSPTYIPMAWHGIWKIWANYNNSQTWIKWIFRRFPY